MKGLELPISTVVVIILVLIVLVAVLGLFYGTWPAGAQLANLESVKNNACQMLMSTGGCDPADHEKTKSVIINNFDADKDGTPGGTDVGSTVDMTGAACTSAADPDDSRDNLFMLCQCYYWITGATEDDLNDNCKTNVCKCPTS